MIIIYLEKSEEYINVSFLELSSMTKNCRKGAEVNRKGAEVKFG